jgi:hypothetical protein
MATWYWWASWSSGSGWLASLVGVRAGLFWVAQWGGLVLYVRMFGKSTKDGMGVLGVSFLEFHDGNAF